MVQTVCLDNKEHAADILQKLKQMRLEEDLCDFTIIVKDDELRTHKCILSAGSLYFKAMFRHDTKECREGKVELKDVDADCVKSCVNFLYSGSFDIPVGKMHQLLHVAIMMQLEKMKQAVCDIMGKSLNSENFFSTREIAKIYDLESVLSTCMTFYCQNFLTMSVKPHFVLEPKSHLVEVFASKYLISSEEAKLQAALRWAEGDASKKEELFEIVQLVNLKDISSDFLKDLLENDPTISTDFQLYKLLNTQLIAVLSDLSKKNEEVNHSLLLFDQNLLCLQSYNLVTNNITRLNHSGFYIPHNFTAVSLERYIYTFGPGEFVYRFNFKEEHSKWERMADMISDHGLFPPSVSLQGCLFVIGAGACIDPCKEAEQFNDFENKWVAVTNRPTAIAGAALVSFGDSIYSIGGWKSKECNQSTLFCRFTPSTSEWVSLEQLKYPRSYSTAVAMEGKIFVAGGFKNTSLLDTMDCYNILLQQWTVMSSMLKKVPDIMACSANSSMYVMGRNRDSDEILKYDITKDQWTVIKMKSIYNACGLVIVPM